MFVALGLITFAPLIVISLSALSEGLIGITMENTVSSALARAEPALGGGDARALQDLADAKAVRIRLLDKTGSTLADYDGIEHDLGLSAINRWFLSEDPAVLLAAYERDAGPLAHRPQVVAATATSAVSCRHGTAGHLYVCAAVRRLDDMHVAYVETISPRSVRALYDFRAQAAKVAVMVLPIALLVGFWLTRNIIRPAEKLRARVLEQTGSPAVGELTTAQDNEIGDLANAFARLVAELDDRRRQNEAFVADLTHELKNPIAALRVSAERLESGELTPERLGRIAGVVGSSAARLDGLVSELLELARVEAGLLDDARQLTDVVQLARGVCQSIEQASATELPEFTFAGAEAPIEVDIDRGRVERALRNILDNAVSFAPAGVVDVQFERTRQNVAIAIGDNGPGIADEDLPRIFERFYTTRPEARGTGLGLPLAQAVAAAHGGTLTASSRPQGGAVFTLTLPFTSDSHRSH